MKTLSGFFALSISAALLLSCTKEETDPIEYQGFKEAQVVDLPDLKFPGSKTPAGKLDRVEYDQYSGKLPDTTLFSTIRMQLFYDADSRVKGVSTITQMLADNRTIEFVTEKRAYQYKDNLLHRVFIPTVTNGANQPCLYAMLEYVYNDKKQATNILYYIVNMDGNAQLKRDNSTALHYDGHGHLLKEENMGSTHAVTYTWDGNNVKSRSEGFADGTYSGTSQYRYDTRPSILKMPYGVSEAMLLRQPGVTSITENNVVSVEGSNAVSYTNRYDQQGRLVERGINIADEAPVIQRFIFRD